MKYSFSSVALALCILLAAGFTAGCGGGEPTERATPTSGNGRPTEQATPTGGGSQPTEQPMPTSGNGQPTEQVTPTSGSQATEQAAPTTDGNQPAEQPTPASDSGQPASPPAATESEFDHIEYMVRLLAPSGSGSFWFVDLASISADPELAPLRQRLEDRWNYWNQESSDEFGITLFDAAYAFAQPNCCVYLGGIADLEGLRETVAGLGYQQQESAGIVYWLNPSQQWDSFTFLPNGVVMIMGQDPALFLEGRQWFLKEELWDEDHARQGYRDRDGQLGIGSTDDLVSDIRDSLVFALNYFEGLKSTWAKAGAGTVEQKDTEVYQDDESAKLEQAKFQEELSQVRAKAERGETEEERQFAELLSACTLEMDRSGKELTLTQACSADWTRISSFNLYSAHLFNVQ